MGTETEQPLAPQSAGLRPHGPRCARHTCRCPQSWLLPARARHQEYAQELWTCVRLGLAAGRAPGAAHLAQVMHPRASVSPRRQVMPNEAVLPCMPHRAEPAIARRRCRVGRCCPGAELAPISREVFTMRPRGHPLRRRAAAGATATTLQHAHPQTSSHRQTSFVASDASVGKCAIWPESEQHWPEICRS